MVISDNFIRLPRGGYVVETPEGRIQFGAPPETIKDTLAHPQGVPDIFVLPRQMFSWTKGINVADMEFPIYYNYFLRQKRPLICGTQDQAVSLATALQEAVFGPRNLDLRPDSIDVGDNVFVPDIREELAFFRGERTLDSLLRYRVFRDRRLTIGRVRIEITETDDYMVFVDDDAVAEVPGTVDYIAQFDGGATLPEPFKPPRFGVTCLGPSHGFDPADNTSGFIIWLNHNGIMVDPPVNSTEWLLQANVNPKFIDSIILTHCHADHDAGTFQKILEEERVTIYTTKTIMGSFLRKYAAFCGESPDYLRRLFSFQPVYIGRPISIHGGEFDIFYSMHSIPTMAFRLSFQDKTFVYSSDHQGDPEVLKQMLNEGRIGTQRYDQLSQFPWDSDVIYHESGIAPLHTPLTYLAALPPDVQKKIVVYHISQSDFEKVESHGIRRATFGIENTLYFDTEQSPYEEAYRSLDVLKRLDFFNSLPIKKVQEFLSIIERRSFSRGESVIKKGTRGDYFFIIESGNAAVIHENLSRQKQLGAFEYFGEVALLTNSPRTADIVADTDLQTIIISKDKFLNFIAGTDFERLLLRIIERRDENVWNLLAGSRSFTRLTDYQRMWMESALQPKVFGKDEVILKKGKALPGVFILAEGSVEVEVLDRPPIELGPGDMIGMMHVLLRDEPARYTFRTLGPVKALFMSRRDALEFVRRNPGASMRISTPYA